MIFPFEKIVFDNIQKFTRCTACSLISTCKIIDTRSFRKSFPWEDPCLVNLSRNIYSNTSSMKMTRMLRRIAAADVSNELRVEATNLKYDLLIPTKVNQIAPRYNSFDRDEQHREQLANRRNALEFSHLMQIPPRITEYLECFYLTTLYNNYCSNVELSHVKTNALAQQRQPMVNDRTSLSKKPRSSRCS